MSWVATPWENVPEGTKCAPFAVKENADEAARSLNEGNRSEISYAWVIRRSQKSYVYAVWIGHLSWNPLLD